MQLRLLTVVERTAQEQSGMIGEAEPLLEMIETSAAADAQRRTRQDDGRHLVEELLPQDRSDLDRGAGEFEALSLVARGLDPVDLVGELLIHPGFEPIGE